MHVLDNGVEQEADLFMLLRPLQHDLRRAKGIASMNNGHFGRKPRQEEGLFHRRIATADHHDLLAREKESIAGRAGRHSMANQLLFMRQSQPPGGSSAGND